MNVSLSLGSTVGSVEPSPGSGDGDNGTPGSLGGYGGSGQTVVGNISLTIGSSGQNSTENTTTLTYQNSTAVSKQVVTTASVTLSDSSNCPITSPPSPQCHGLLQTQPSVNFYLDRIFGGFMFQDPYAPKGFTRAKAPACCAMLVRALVAEEKRNQRFTDVPTSDVDAGEIGLLARAGVLPGYADGTFRPNEPFTREQLAQAIQEGMHLSSSAVSKALEGIPASGPITEANLAAAFSRAGMTTTTLPKSNNSLTRAEAASWIFEALKDH